MKVTKIYDFSVKEIEDSSKDKVIIEMSTNEFIELSEVLYLSKLYTDKKSLAERNEKILKEFEVNLEIKSIE